jgi:hypothetical protein
MNIYYRSTIIVERRQERPAARDGWMTMSLVRGNSRFAFARPK